MNREERDLENIKQEASDQEVTIYETINGEDTNNEVINHDMNSDKINLVVDRDKEALKDDRNAKERLYDKIPISLKALDIVIGILITILVILLLYFILRRFS